VNRVKFAECSSYVSIWTSALDLLFQVLEQYLRRYISKQLHPVSLGCAVYILHVWLIEMGGDIDLVLRVITVLVSKCSLLRCPVQGWDSFYLTQLKGRKLL